ncbi:MAG: hypothetical protein ACT4OZ_16010 [Gemmatimonadota bacterium]
MPKPKKIELASQSRLELVEDLAPRFFAEVFDYDYSECLITDESDLRDFASVVDPIDPQVQEMLARFEAHYFVAPPTDSTRIVDLLEFLRNRGVTG